MTIKPIKYWPLIIMTGTIGTSVLFTILLKPSLHFHQKTVRIFKQKPSQPILGQTNLNKEHTMTIHKNRYNLTYGLTTAPHHVVNFFDVNCEHCLTFYQSTWPTIKKQFVDTGKLRFTFAPYPVHTETLLMMSCSEELDPVLYHILFECVMETDHTTQDTLKTCMDVLHKPFRPPSATALKEALLLTQKHKFEALPMMFLDGQVITDEQLDNLVNFLEEHIR